LPGRSVVAAREPRSEARYGQQYFSGYGPLKAPSTWMAAYLARRLAFAAFLVVAVSSGSLILARLAPGDFVTQSMGIDANREEIERQRARLGLNRSIAAQYRDWLIAAAHLDFGRSLLYDRPVKDLIPER